MRKTLIALSLVALAAAGTASIALGATRTVTARGVAWSPKTLIVKKGTTVRWTWKGSLPHNVRGPGVRTATSKRGSASRRFTRKGSFTYVCTIHKRAGMKMTVKVR